MKKIAIYGTALAVTLLLALPAQAGVGGAYEGVGGAYDGVGGAYDASNGKPDHAAHPTPVNRPTNPSKGKKAAEGVGGAFEGVGGAYEGVGGAYEGVGGAYEGVGGAYEGVGGAYEGVGGAFERLKQLLPEWVLAKLPQASR